MILFGSVDMNIELLPEPMLGIEVAKANASEWIVQEATWIGYGIAQAGRGS